MTWWRPNTAADGPKQRHAARFPDRSADTIATVNESSRPVAITNPAAVAVGRGMTSSAHTANSAGTTTSATARAPAADTGSRFGIEAVNAVNAPLPATLPSAERRNTAPTRQRTPVNR